MVLTALSGDPFNEVKGAEQRGFQWNPNSLPLSYVGAQNTIQKDTYRSKKRYSISSR